MGNALHSKAEQRSNQQKYNKQTTCMHVLSTLRCAPPMPRPRCPCTLPTQKLKPVLVSRQVNQVIQGSVHNNAVILHATLVLDSPEHRFTLYMVSESMATPTDSQSPSSLCFHSSIQPARRDLTDPTVSEASTSNLARSATASALCSPEVQLRCTHPQAECRTLKVEC